MPKFTIWEIRSYEIAAETQDEAQMIMEAAYGDFTIDSYFQDNWEQWYLKGTEPEPGPYHV